MEDMPPHSGLSRSIWARAERIAGRYLAYLALDAMLVVFSFYLALTLRFSGRTPDYYEASLVRYALPIAAMFLASNLFFKLYQRLWQYASSQEAISIVESTVVSTVLLVVADILWRPSRPLPTTVVLFGGFFCFVSFTIARYRFRLVTGFVWRWRTWRNRKQPSGSRVLIVGAGEKGQLLAWQLENQREGRRYHLVGIVDGDAKKVGMLVHGVKVLGHWKEIPFLVSALGVELIIIAIGELSGEEFNQVLSLCQETEAQIKVLPGVFELIERANGSPPLREVRVEDLLGREPVLINREACRELIRGKRVLVTGAAGSIGAELCRQIVELEPERLLMVDTNETGLYDLNTELERRPMGARAVCLVADITHQPKMEALFRRYWPQVVFHAAAYKHVPMMEESPDEAVRVNVWGTMVVEKLARECGTERLVLVSTDKAVNPTSVMGVSKWISEALVVGARESPTLRTAVRFGNVLGSRGSVVPTFEKQIELGGPVTITDPQMERFFMSIQEAAALIIQAAALTAGGETFILDMGRQINIVELAQRMLRLRGLRVGKDIQLEFIGPRPGEKLTEELVGQEEEVQPTSHPSIMRVRSNHDMDCLLFLAQVERLVELAKEAKPEETRAELWHIVQTFGPKNTREMKG